MSKCLKIALAIAVLAALCHWTDAQAPDLMLHFDERTHVFSLRNVPSDTKQQLRVHIQRGLPLQLGDIRVTSAKGNDYFCTVLTKRKLACVLNETAELSIELQIYPTNCMEPSRIAKISALQKDAASGEVVAQDTLSFAMQDACINSDIIGPNIYEAISDASSVGMTPAIVDASGVRRSKRVSVNIDDLKVMASEMFKKKREDPTPSEDNMVSFSMFDGEQLIGHVTSADMPYLPTVAREDDSIAEDADSESGEPSPVEVELAGSLSAKFDSALIGDWYMSIVGDVAVGHLYVGDKSYQIRYEALDQGGAHTLNELDVTLLPKKSCEVLTPDNATVNGKREETFDDRPISSDDPGRVDVLLCYTTAVKNSLGGTNAAIALCKQAVTLANAAYVNSKVGMVLRLVGTCEVTEAGFDSSTLDALSKLSRGQVSVVANAREQYGADVVSVFLQTSSVCGQGYLYSTSYSDFAPYAINVVAPQCVSQSTFAHEVGHNMGLCHDSANSCGGQPLKTYAYGNHFSSYRTIMAYPPGTRINYFSGPNVYYNGQATGVSGVTDCARVLNEHLHIYPNWRQAKCAYTETPNNPYPCLSTCGDGVKDGAEGCDDGNKVSGDGCSSSCTIESGYSCTGSPSKCVKTAGLTCPTISSSNVPHASSFSCSGYTAGMVCSYRCETGYSVGSAASGVGASVTCGSTSASTVGWLPSPTACTSVSPYKYITGAFTACTGECGMGTQTRTVTCVSTANDMPVAESYCVNAGLSKPYTTQACTLTSSKCGTNTMCVNNLCVCRTGYSGNPLTSCTFVDYTYKYVVGQFSACTGECGMGTQTRSVQCVGVNGATKAETVVAESYCVNAGLSKPHASQGCTLTYSKCGANTMCVNDKCVCRTGYSGDPLTGCSVVTYTYKYTTGSFAACTGECGMGTQTRSVQCVGVNSATKAETVVAESYCVNAGLFKPYTTQACTLTYSKCGDNAECTENRCVCKDGYSGNPLSACYRKTCTRHNDCIDWSGAPVDDPICYGGVCRTLSVVCSLDPAPVPPPIVVDDDSETATSGNKVTVGLVSAAGGLAAVGIATGLVLKRRKKKSKEQEFTDAVTSPSVPRAH